MDQPLPVAPSASWQPELDELAERKRIVREMGGADRIARQYPRGRLTVRERIQQLLDDGSFQETGTIAGKAIYEASSRVMTGFMLFTKRP